MSDPTRIYQDDPFCSRFEGVVTGCTQTRGGWAVTLDRTAFFPEGGGQPCDMGTLTAADGTEANVLEVHEKDGLVVHTLDAALPVGAAVKGVLDWERRVDAMEQHSGEHILSGILHRLYGAENVGFHIGPDQVRMDMSVELSPEQLRQAELLANAAVRRDVPVAVTYPSREELAALTYRSKKEIEGQVRIVEIPGADVCACCGTHVERTGQVGLIKILSHQNYKGGTRLAVACGGRAVAALAVEHEALVAAAQALSAKPLALPEAVDRLLAESMGLKAARTEAENRWFEAVAQSAVPGRCCVVKAEGLNGDSLRRLCLACSERSGALTAAFCPNGQGGLSYALTLPGGDARPLCKALNDAFAGRGGGKPIFCQGSVTRGTFDEIKEFLQNM